MVHNVNTISTASSWFFPRKEENSMSGILHGTRSSMRVNRSISGLDLGKNWKNLEKISSSDHETDKKPGFQSQEIDSFESFMKKHLSHYGYYSKCKSIFFVSKFGTSPKIDFCKMGDHFFDGLINNDIT
jgi:hypothetical protein